MSELEAKIVELKHVEERQREFIKMQETMIQNLRSDNDSLRQRNTDLENALKKCEQELVRKKDRDNYDKYMISFRQAS
jgi:cell division protein FtsB